MNHLHFDTSSTTKLLHSSRYLPQLSSKPLLLLLLSGKGHLLREAAGLICDLFVEENPNLQAN